MHRNAQREAALHEEAVYQLEACVEEWLVALDVIVAAGRVFYN